MSGAQQPARPPATSAPADRAGLTRRRSRQRVLAATLLYLAIGSVGALAQSDESAGDGDSEVERLQQLLLRFQAEARGDEPAPPSDTPLFERPPDTSLTAFEAQLARGFTADKLLLRDDELPLLIASIETRLNDSLLEEPRNDAPLIGSRQTRKRGALVGSHSYSLRHIGRHNFVGRLDLGAGSNTLSIIDQQWTVNLPETHGDASYIVLLYAAPLDDWELHLISASAIAAQDAGLPGWLTGLTEHTPET